MCVPGRPGNARPAPKGSGDKKDAPAMSCPLTCTLDARWSETAVHCGDKVKLTADVSPPPADGPATIDILRIDDSGARAPVQSLHTTIKGGHIEETWVAKAPTAGWREDRLRFRVIVPGTEIKGISRNELTFKQRPTTGATRIDRDLDRPAHHAPPSEICDATLERERVRYVLKLKTTGREYSSSKQTLAKDEIEGTWNWNFELSWMFHRERCQRGRACNCTFDCCKVGYRLDVHFVDGGEHVSIEIKRGPGRARMGRHGSEWYDPATDVSTVYAHEAGHVLGQYDEYLGGANDPNGVQPANAPDPNLMSIGEASDPTHMKTHRLFDRHFRWVLKFLNDHADGDQYATIPRR